MKGRAVTPEQKREVIERILEAWIRLHPHERLGQMLHNACSSDGDFFYIEDDRIAELAERKSYGS